MSNSSLELSILTSKVLRLRLLITYNIYFVTYLFQILFIMDFKKYIHSQVNEPDADKCFTSFLLNTDAISKIALAPIDFDSITWYSSTIKSFLNRGI